VIHLNENQTHFDRSNPIQMITGKGEPTKQEMNALSRRSLNSDGIKKTERNDEKCGFGAEFPPREWPFFDKSGLF